MSDGMKLAAVGDEETITWLRLAGIREVYQIDDVQEAFPTFKQLIRRKDIAVIFTTPEIMRHESLADLLKEAARQTYPIILELPSLEEIEEEEGADPIREMVKYAIGVDIF